MAISIETLALARKYADAVAAAGSKEALDKAIQQAIAESKLYTDDVFSHIVSFKVEIVDSLPETDIDPHVIYFLKRENPSGEEDFYYEYMYINNFWELIGSTQLDLSPYWTIEQTKAYIASKEYSLPRANNRLLEVIMSLEKNRLLSEISNYELININDGEKYDYLNNNDLVIDNEGYIHVVDKYTKDTATNVAQNVIDENFDNIKDTSIENLFK